MNEQSDEKKIKKFFLKLGLGLRRINNHLSTSFKLFYRSRLTVFLFIITPILLLLLFGSIFGESNLITYDLLVQNNDDSPYATDFIRELGENIFLETEELDTTIDPEVYMQQNKKIACLVIPINWYSDSLIYPKSNITLILDTTSINAERIEQIVRKEINEYYFLLNNTDTLVGINLVDFDTEGKYIDFIIPGIIGVIIMNTGILGTIMRNVHFKKIGLLRKLTTTPIKKSEYIIGELIWQLLIALIATLLAVLTSIVVFGFNWHSFTAMIVPVILVGVVLFTGIGLILGQLVKRNGMLIGLLITVPMMFLSGVFFDVSEIRSMFIISRFFPLSFIVEALRSSLVSGSLVEAGIKLAIALGIGIVAIVFGVLLARWEKEN
jgi:ABC-2 type transport system permease protein